ncbi:MAG: ribosomal protein S18-alanine N-acetyltransferase [Clostridia bacterium]|nr:ribosomal protein S18-alanine N-acetyltransferase [Clostridia bacterium]
MRSCRGRGSRSSPAPHTGQCTPDRSRSPTGNGPGSRSSPPRTRSSDRGSDIPAGPGRVIACAGAEIDNDTAEIESIAVAPEYRRIGVAKILLAKLLDAITKRGATFIVLEVRPSNKAAIELYKKFGFQIVEREKNYYWNEDAWIMARDFS